MRRSCRPSDQTSSGASVLADSLQKQVDDLGVQVTEASTKLIDYEKTHNINGTLDPTGELATARIEGPAPALSRGAGDPGAV